MATTSISLIREQSEAVEPPRALWVPFPLGRPLGAAEDRAFQLKVLRHAFLLLESAEGPVIEDFLEEAPFQKESEAWACPVSFPVIESEEIDFRLRDEINRLRPWSQETRIARGRSLFGVSGADSDQVTDVVDAVLHIIETGDVLQLPPSKIEWRFEMPLLIRHLADDLRTFYHEALAAQPGEGAPSHKAFNDFIFGGTALGDAFQALAGKLTEEGSAMSLIARGFILPEGYYKGGSAFPTPSELQEKGFSLK